ncbi:hypothetical protein FB567DRAFT_541928 [Paraphoma chrysanthemicola]|uniref:BZIP domain-containing protein n=1 Tax=Paraphoma chrysanthemicola TaxID=798071 RepID=A0A8K0VR04_9PLEO|nr:hypothetical protein FB567DRAFT_541928 [Paraphoma chrysanthemicola]
MPPNRPETNEECASRIRDNKRRHRARQKEYILELQRTVAETRERGIQVTKEVQIAAQGVARENAKLRDLLRLVGYTDNTIDAWVKGDINLHNADHTQPGSKPLLEQIEHKVPLACGLRKEQNFQPQNVGVDKPILIRESESAEHSDKALDLTELPIPSASPCEKTDSSTQDPQSGRAPCKLVTLLARNPAADITQVLLPRQLNRESDETGKPEGCGADGIECSDAYSMLMRYATSTESMDRIAVALESGCTPSTAGGCRVKKSVVWSALDKEFA